MGFDDFFEKDHGHHKHDHGNYYRHDDYYRSSQLNNYANYKYQLLSKLQRNPKLRGLIIAVFIVLFLIIATIVILFIPLLIKLFNFLTENGLQGLLDMLWNGTK